MCIRIIPNSITYLIGNIILQPAFFNSEHFIESVRDMEANSIHLFIDHILVHFFFRQPTLIGKRKFQFIAVEYSLLRA